MKQTYFHFQINSLQLEWRKKKTPRYVRANSPNYEWNTIKWHLKKYWRASSNGKTPSLNEGVNRPAMFKEKHPAKLQITTGSVFRLEWIIHLCLKFFLHIWFKTPLPTTGAYPYKWFAWFCRGMADYQQRRERHCSVYFRARYPLTGFTKQIPFQKILFHQGIQDPSYLK